MSVSQSSSSPGVVTGIIRPKHGLACVAKQRQIEDKIDRKDLLVVVFRKIFPDITDEQLEIIEDILLYLLNNKIVKKIPLLQYGIYQTKKLVLFFLNNVDKIVAVV